MSSVKWTATSPRSGRFSAAEGGSDMQGLSKLHDELRTRGQGYIEVRLPTGEFPLLTMASEATTQSSICSRTLKRGHFWSETARSPRMP